MNNKLDDLFSWSRKISVTFLLLSYLKAKFRFENFCPSVASLRLIYPSAQKHYKVREQSIRYESCRDVSGHY
jgi:hypothetical protein